MLVLARVDCDSRFLVRVLRSAIAAHGTLSFAPVFDAFDDKARTRRSPFLLCAHSALRCVQGHQGYPSGQRITRKIPCVESSSLKTVFTACVVPALFAYRHSRAVVSVSVVALRFQRVSAIAGGAPVLLGSGHSKLIALLRLALPHALRLV